MAGNTGNTNRDNCVQFLKGGLDTIEKNEVFSKNGKLHMGSIVLYHYM